MPINLIIIKVTHYFRLNKSFLHWNLKICVTYVSHMKNSSYKKCMRSLKIATYYSLDYLFHCHRLYLQKKNPLWVQILKSLLYHLITVTVISPIMQALYGMNIYGKDSLYQALFLACLVVDGQMGLNGSFNFFILIFFSMSVYYIYDKKAWKFN